MNVSPTCLTVAPHIIAFFLRLQHCQSIDPFLFLRLTLYEYPTELVSLECPNLDEFSTIVHATEAGMSISIGLGSSSEIS